jgi:hypothetical protein
MDLQPQSTGFYYLNYVWFTVKLFQVSIVPLPPLPSVTAFPRVSNKMSITSNDVYYIW